MNESEFARREAEEINAENNYFDARPELDTQNRRQVFEAGFIRGYDSICPKYPQDGFEANKQLISASPDLLAICEKLVALKDLWLIPEDVPPEHQGEAETMHLLFLELKRAIRKAVEE